VSDCNGKSCLVEHPNPLMIVKTVVAFKGLAPSEMFALYCSMDHLIDDVTMNWERTELSDQERARRELVKIWQAVYRVSQLRQEWPVIARLLDLLAEVEV
jgi:hypothetical protein